MYVFNLLVSSKKIFVWKRVLCVCNLANYYSGIEVLFFFFFGGKIFPTASNYLLGFDEKKVCI